MVWGFGGLRCFFKRFQFNGFFIRAFKVLGFYRALQGYTGFSPKCNRILNERTFCKRQLSQSIGLCGFGVFRSRSFRVEVRGFKRGHKPTLSASGILLYLFIPKPFIPTRKCNAFKLIKPKAPMITNFQQIHTRRLKP